MNKEKKLAIWKELYGKGLEIDDEFVLIFPVQNELELVVDTMDENYEHPSAAELLMQPTKKAQ